MNNIITVELFAKKILKNRQIFFFHYYDGESQYDEALGKYFGYYENNQNGSDPLYFYDKGICWKKNDGDFILFYDDIKSIKLEDEKKSLALLVELKDNSTIRLPVKGKKDKFVDSLQIYTFLYEVVWRVYKKNLSSDNNE